MTEPIGGRPQPGSNAAIDAGCTCPVMDNGHGRGYMGGLKDADGNVMFVMDEACPLHGIAALARHEEIK